MESASSFYRAWFRTSLISSVGLGDLIGGLTGAGLSIAAHFVPAWERPVNDLLWEIPILALVGAFIVRLALAPWELHREARKAADAAEKTLELTIGEQAAELANLKAAKPNLSLHVSEVIWGGKAPDRPNERVVVVIVRVANRGVLPSATDDWKMSLMSGEEEISLKLAHVKGTLTLEGYSGRGYVLHSKDAIYEKAATAVQPGQFVNGFLFAIGPEALVESARRGVVSCRDIHGDMAAADFSVPEHGGPEELIYTPGVQKF